MLLKILVVVAIFLSVSGLAVAEVRNESIHIRAQESVALSRDGVKVPKVYVLSQGGSLIFEGEASADQAFAPIIKALATGKEQKRASAPAITKLLKEAGFLFEQKGEPMLVTLEIGSSIGNCAACDPYYPNLEQALDARGMNVRWLHVLFEKNDYKAPAKR